MFPFFFISSSVNPHAFIQGFAKSIGEYQTAPSTNVAKADTTTASQLMFEYSDDGKGIPEENLSKIFDPFFTTKRGQGGSGLGLHIIYNLVTQKLAGTIRCESKPGQGTKFIIMLALQREPINGQ